jgi:hypothetical protein
VLSSFGGSGNAQGGIHLVAQNVLVLSAPGGGGGGGLNNNANAGGNIVLSVNSRVAQEMAFVADNGKTWILLRPPVGAVAASGSSSQGGR